MRMFVRIIFTLCVIGMAGCGAGGPFGTPRAPVYATVTPDRCTIGTPVEYRLAVSGIRDGGVKIELPPKGTRFPGPEARDPHMKTAVSAGGVKSKEATHLPLCVVREASFGKEEDGTEARVAIVTLAFLRTGSFELPEITVKGADGVQIGYVLPRITVEPVNPSNEFQEIGPPREFGGNYTRICLLGALALVLIVAGIFAWRRYRHGIPVYDAEVIPEAPLDIFLETLAALKAARLDEKGSGKEIAVEIHDALRGFVGAQCGMDAMEMTGTEMLAALKACAPEGTELERLAECLDLWELAKFAEFEAPAGALTRSLDGAEAVARAIAGRWRGGRP
jgi:hypothetical protein